METYPSLSAVSAVVVRREFVVKTERAALARHRSRGRRTARNQRAARGTPRRPGRTIVRENDSVIVPPAASGRERRAASVRTAAPATDQPIARSASMERITTRGRVEDPGSSVRRPESPPASPRAPAPGDRPDPATRTLCHRVVRPRDTRPAATRRSSTRPSCSSRSPQPPRARPEIGPGGDVGGNAITIALASACPLRQPEPHRGEVSTSR